ncbi:MAG: GNAT family N-acetyltransferase [Bacteroidia bacterium]
MVTAPITIHRATLVDIPTLVQLRIEFFEVLKGPQPDEAKEALAASLREYYESAMTSGDCINCLAYCGEDVAGVGSMVLRTQAGNFANLSGRFGYVMNMYTLPDFRRRGVATQILNALVGYGKEWGVTAFELHATEEGEPVYAQYGFERHHEPTMRFHLQSPES